MGIATGKAVWTAESQGTELLDLTIGDLLDRQAEVWSDREALIYSYPEIGTELRLTYRQYRDEANRLAKGLLALGIARGEHIAIWATNVPEWALLQMAVAKIGAVLVTVNTNYRASELEYVLRQGDVSTLVMIGRHRDNDFREAILTIAPELQEVTAPATQSLRAAKLPVLKRVVFLGGEAPAGMLPYDRLHALGESVTDEALQTRQATVDPQDVAQMQFTSGTTGFPKGVQMTHHGMVNNAFLTCGRLGLDSAGRIVSPMPFFHVAGSVFSLLGPVCFGAALIPLIAFDPLKQLELLASERGTFFVGVPTMLIAVLNHPRFAEFDLSSMRGVGSGGSPVPVALMEQYHARTGAQPWIIYGMTEAHCTITFTMPDDPLALKIGSVGAPLPHIDVMIADPRTGEPVGLGERGELCMRGFLVTKGYYRMPEKTAETIDEDGWLHSGDLATMNAEGRVNIVGRVKEMIIRGGENLFPAEIEAFFMHHPKIAEAQIVGVPDAFMGEELVALLRLKPGETAGEEEMREYCRDNISRQKTPKYIRFVDAYPLTASGKVQKFVLQEQLIRELGLEEVAKTKMA
ncbi:MAG: AMP-binding protein [Blastocatellia bacterium]|nr:AMP-binding protein [Blastocatellia bacterium]